jgi:hypothetical protein
VIDLKAIPTRSHGVLEGRRLVDLLHARRKPRYTPERLAQLRETAATARARIVRKNPGPHESADQGR